jgi:hypothetical protein
MKRISLLLALAVLFTVVVTTSATAVTIEITATADNLVGAWYQNGNSPVEIALPDDPDNSLKDWRTPDTFSVDLEPCDIREIIFHVINDDNDAGYRAPSNSNPGGFLAQASAQYLDQSDSYMGTPLSNLLSDATWKVAR